MKQWVHKLVQQLDIEVPWPHKDAESVQISEDRATLLYILDIYSKHLVDITHHPVRKVRETLDEISKELVSPVNKTNDKLLFRLRQFFSGYRIDEYSYIQKTFEDFKTILWDFVDQLGEDFAQEKAGDKNLLKNLTALKEAVEANSIDEVKSKSREFIDLYVETQTKKEKRRSHRISTIKKNLDTVKKQLNEANHSMRMDHLTGAFNRRSFDEALSQQKSLFDLTRSPVCLLSMDIDHFKKINDSYGHDIGDFVLKETVRLLKSIFQRDADFVARVGGEEFSIILPDMNLELATVKANTALQIFRKEVFIIKENLDLKFTVSMGLAQLHDSETTDQWLKRADQALYSSKNSGRDRLTVAGTSPRLTQVA